MRSGSAGTPPLRSRQGRSISCAADKRARIRTSMGDGALTKPEQQQEASKCRDVQNGSLFSLSGFRSYPVYALVVHLQSISNSEMARSPTKGRKAKGPPYLRPCELEKGARRKSRRLGRAGRNSGARINRSSSARPRVCVRLQRQKEFAAAALRPKGGATNPTGPRRVSCVDGAREVEIRPRAARSPPPGKPRLGRTFPCVSGRIRRKIGKGSTVTCRSIGSKARISWCSRVKDAKLSTAYRQLCSSFAKSVLAQGP
jgi:hypothetical protein